MQFSSLLGHTQELLGLILKSNRPADSLMDVFFRSHKYLGSHDRRFIAETTYGTLRHLRRCELILVSALVGFEEVLFDADRTLLLIIAYLSFQGKMQGGHLESVSAKLKSMQLKEQMSQLIPNLSRTVAVPMNSIVQRIGTEYSFPDWMVQRFVEQYGEDETQNICSSLNEQAPLSLRVNTLKASVEQCQESLRREGVETLKTSLSPFGLNIVRRMNVFSLQAFQDGWFEVQDEGSQLLPLFIDPKPNAKVLDPCAGAGGKTLEFAALMKNRGEIFATDVNGFRLEELRKRAKRAGAQNIRVQEIQSIENLANRYNAFFDIVFIDAPCSGLGTIRRNPGLKWIVTEQTVHEVSEKQKAILHSSATLVKPGGKLVYATCTMLKQENEDVVEKFFIQHPEFIVANSNRIKDKWCVEATAESSFLKLLPHINGTDGFFCAVLEKQVVR